MIDRPNPVYVKMADGTGRKMYETLAVELFIADQALENDSLKRQVEHWKLIALAPR